MLSNLARRHFSSSVAAAAKSKVYVVGVGMTKFVKPGSVANFDYPDMVKEAGTKALADAGVPYEAIEQAVAGYVYGDSTSGQRAIYGLGLTGIPVYNTNNNCSTGSSALMLAKQLVEGGIANCVMAVGFEKMQRGSLDLSTKDRASPLDRHMATMANINNGVLEKAPPAPWLFGMAGREHMQKYGTKKESFGRIAQKNHKHSVNNEYAQFRDEYTLEQIMQSKAITEPLTMLQCSPTSDGAAAAVLVSEAFVKLHNLQDKAVEIAGQAMATDMPSSFGKSAMAAVGTDMTRKAATQALAQAGVKPTDVQVIELHDCFSTNELITYEGLGLCEEGKGASLIDNGDVTYGGRWVVNPSGGLISKGHPLGATGLAQCAELTWQLRGTAGKRQVSNARVALQHNLGLGGAAVVTVYKR
ncbi:lipid-transfer protein [Capsaspora owczarzaki ATCC 30864]|uniref:lipid-transfer protein n=1 Tax=Capsaspora owczarzaki (strain ATCC 30864) TaxID=595528 RepID=UPI0003524AF4|nr:lipid-transfer protein [Capsaspora owczarzaki ATCC 30864]|eukprot:XP_004346192.2 lipid-transfer protein [Capsaspora owczarzaki ATCC 30864]